jgi:putative redox protein
MKVAVRWQENMTFIGTPDSDFSVQMDADSSFGGTNQGVRPMEMVALGLAGCTAMDVISILQKKRQQVTQFEVRVNAPRSAEHPKVFTRALITYIVTGKNVDESALLRSIELAATKYCPAQLMLAQVFPRELHYEIYEEIGDGMRQLACQGIWQELPLE